VLWCPARWQRKYQLYKKYICFYRKAPCTIINAQTPCKCYNSNTTSNPAQQRCLLGGAAMTSSVHMQSCFSLQRSRLPGRSVFYIIMCTSSWSCRCYSDSRHQVHALPTNTPKQCMPCQCHTRLAVRWRNLHTVPSAHPVMSSHQTASWWLFKVCQIKHSMQVFKAGSLNCNQGVTHAAISHIASAEFSAVSLYPCAAKP
jgi:hypothetical protein